MNTYENIISPIDFPRAFIFCNSTSIHILWTSFTSLFRAYIYCGQAFLDTQIWRIYYVFGLYKRFWPTNRKYESLVTVYLFIVRSWNIVVPYKPCYVLTNLVPATKMIYFKALDVIISIFHPGRCTRKCHLWLMVPLDYAVGTKTEMSLHCRTFRH